MAQISGIASNLGGSLEYRRFQITYSDLTTADTTHTQALMTLPAGGAQILGVFVKHSTAFSGGSLSSMTVSVGKSGSVTFFTSTFDIYQAVADTTVQETSLFKKGQLTALPVIATFTGSHNVNTATAGVVDIYILYVNQTTP